MTSEQKTALKAGIFVLVCMAVLIGVILSLGKSSQMLEEQYTLNAYYHDVGGLLSGAPVRISGVNAGAVGKIKIQEKNIQVELLINAKLRKHIRADSTAAITSTGPLGEKYVEITMSGDPKALELKEGGRITAIEPVKFVEIVKGTKILLKKIQKGPGMLHRLIYDKELAAKLNAAATAATALNEITAHVQAGKGNLGMLVYGKRMDQTLTDLQKMVASIKTVVTHVEEGKGNLGALVYGKQLDETLSGLQKAVADVRAVTKEVREGDGLLHALLYDKHERQALTEFSQAAARLNAILGRVERKEGTLGLLTSDPAVWESLRRLLGGVERSRILRFLIRRGIKKGAPPPRPEPPAKTSPKPPPSPSGVRENK